MSSCLALLLALALLAGTAAAGAAQSVSAEVDALLRQADDAAAKGLPAAPLTNKIREGLAKGHDPKAIALVVRQMLAHLEAAARVVRETEPSASVAGREASVTLLAEALGSGLTEEEVRELRRLVQSPGKPATTAEELAGAAKALSLIKDAELPVADGTAVIAEAMRQRFRSREILDLGREVKRREGEYRSGRASLRALRDAIARGDRPEQLFRDTLPTTVERPTGVRSQAPVDRPERPVRPEPQRPERPVRPERPAAVR